MLCGCALHEVDKDLFVCPVHKTQHVCGSKCNMKTVEQKGQIVCPLTSRVLGRVDVDSAGIRNFGSTSRRPAKRRKNMCGLVTKSRPVPLPDITVLPLEQEVKEDSGTSRSRRATRSEEPLSKFIGVLRKLLYGKKRDALTKLNRKRRIDAMLDAGKTYLSNAQRQGQPGSLVDVMAAMEKAVPNVDVYRFVGVPGPVLDDVIFFLATYIQGCYRIVAPLRDQLQAYSMLPDSQRVHGITRGQGSRATVKMNVETFTVQIIKIMGRGGMTSLVDGRVLIPEMPICDLAFPLPGQMSRVVDKMTRFKLEPLLRHADQVPNDIVGDASLTLQRAISTYASLVVHEHDTVARCCSLMRLPYEMGPFGVYGDPGERSLIVPTRVGEVLQVEQRQDGFRKWTDAQKHSSR